MSGEEDSGETIAKVKSPSGEMLAVKAQRQHWVTTIPIMAVLAVTFAAGVTVNAINAAKESSARDQQETRQELRDLAALVKDQAAKTDARVRVLEDKGLREDVMRELRAKR